LFRRKRASAKRRNVSVSFHHGFPLRSPASPAERSSSAASSRRYSSLDLPVARRKSASSKDASGEARPSPSMNSETNPEAKRWR
jgi:hypothetical protein